MIKAIWSSNWFGVALFASLGIGTYAAYLFGSGAQEPHYSFDVVIDSGDPGPGKDHPCVSDQAKRCFSIHLEHR